jgi:uncharacterized protein
MPKPGWRIPSIPDRPAVVALAETAYGLGVFATDDLPAGTAATPIAGRLCSLADVPRSEIGHALWLGGESWMLLEAPARYVNHSCAPNARIMAAADGRHIVTKRPVRAGEQITITYDVVSAAEFAADGDDPMFRFWHPRWSFDCRCGAPSCRGRIDGYVVESIGSDGAPAYGRIPPWVAPLGPAQSIEPRHIPGKGRGVVTTRALRPGEVVERAPVIVIPAEQWPAIETTTLYDYSFAWGESLQHAALALGYGSLYNHSSRPNCRFLRRLDEAVIDFIVCRAIAAGEELTISYTLTYDGLDVWFEAVE